MATSKLVTEGKGAGEMASQLGALAALAGNPGLLPRTRFGWLIATCTSSRGSDGLLWPLPALHTNGA